MVNSWLILSCQIICEFFVKCLTLQLTNFNNHLKSQIVKKFLFAVCFTLLGGVLLESSASEAKQNLNLQVGIVEPSDSHGDHPRTPVARPSVSQDDHTLYFNNVGYDLALVLLDENGDEVYTAYVTVGTTAVVLPASFSGDFELQLHPGGSFYFYSEISL